MKKQSKCFAGIVLIAIFVMLAGITVFAKEKTTEVYVEQEDEQAVDVAETIEEKETPENSEGETPQAPEEILKEGFVEEDGETFYYISGAKQFGWKKIENVWYYFGTNGKMIKGWLKVGSVWYYFNQEGIMQTGLQKINAVTYFFENSGAMYNKTGWKYQDGKWYYFTSSGAALFGWKSYNYQWYYMNSDGVMVTGVQKINGKIYCFAGNGAMREKEGWLYQDGKWFYLNAKGEARTGWIYVKNLYYYLDSDGVMLTGKQMIDGKEYYLEANGVLRSGWRKVNNAWYYYSPEGVMQTGWQQIAGKWYYMNSNGVMQTGWLRIGEDWYYLDASGARKSGWLRSGKDWYYLNSEGKMLTGWQYCGGLKYYFNLNGSLKQDVRGLVSGPYCIKVNKQQNCVTVYAKDGANGYIIPIKAFICSAGEGTPVGTFKTPVKYRWHALIGSYGQYCTRIVGNYLFHSVPYRRNGDPKSLMTNLYNRLGNKDSMGCIRLTVADAKWIYDNCSLGTQVTIYNSSSVGPFDKPTAAKLPSWQTWDPTDYEALK